MPNLQSEPLNPDTSEKSTDLSALEQQLQEVEELTFKLKKLLVKNEDTLDQEGIRQQIETLERWTESYRRGLKAANNISQTGITWLEELRDKLKLSADEILRLEDEGGNPVTQEQSEKADALLKATRSLDKVIPAMEGIFKPAETDAGKSN